jgi:cytochrome c553
LVSAKRGLDTSMTLMIKGQKSFRKWTFPSVKGGCNDCHRQFASGTQGEIRTWVFAHQLNRPSVSDPNLNQIRMLFQKKILGWTKAEPTELEIKAMPKWARITDTLAPLELRARSYIGANCTGCHGTRGIATGDTIKPQLIVPGYPELSTILKRIKSRNTSAPDISKDTAYRKDENQMPYIGIYEVDTVATRWIAQWINEMPDIVGINPKKGSVFGKLNPEIVGDILTIPAGVDGGLILAGLNGKKYSLTRIMGNNYCIPDNLKTGLYMLRVGNRTFKILR